VFEVQEQSRDEALRLVLETAPTFSDESLRENAESVAATMRSGLSLSLW
jgi:hypothetical protein